MDRYCPIPSPTDSDTLACLSVLVKIQHNLLECHDSETLFASLLPDIRLAACTSYAYFFRNVPLFDGQPTYSLVAESHLPNLPPRKDRPNFALLPHAHLPNWTATLMNHGLVFGTPNDFAGEERFFMSLHGIHSILLVPVIAGKQFLGFLGIDDCVEERKWSEADKAPLAECCLCAGSCAFAVADYPELAVRLPRKDGTDRDFGSRP
jgi:GAF domain-containing protein